MPDDRSRMEVVQALSEKLSPQVAAALMECVPPFAWTEIATKHDLNEFETRMGLRFEILETKFEALDAKLEGRLEGFEGRLLGFEGRLEGFEGRMTALIQEKLSAQNRTLLIAAAAAIIGSIAANLIG